jgi:hypothetical protein
MIANFLIGYSSNVTNKLLAKTAYEALVIAIKVLGSPAQKPWHLVLTMGRDIAIGREIHAHKVPFWIDIDSLTKVPVFV